MYSLEFDPGWDRYFEKLDRGIQQRMLAKINQLKVRCDEGLSARHLQKGLPYFVVELGKYRICFKKTDEEKIIRLYFAGHHKDYEKWIGLR